MKYLYKTLLISTLFLFGMISVKATGRKISLRSPNSNLEAEFTLYDQLRYTLSYKGQLVMLPSFVGLELSDRTIGKNPEVIRIRKRTHRGVIKPLYGQSAWLSDVYNELEIKFKGDYSLLIRAYDEGIAYRLITTFKDSITVVNEIADFNLSQRLSAIFPQVDNFTVWEMPYVSYSHISEIENAKKAVTPALFSDAQTGLTTVVAESDVLDYPGMYIQKSEAGMQGLWAPYPEKTELGSWGNFVSVVKERKSFIARTTGKRSFTWRIVMITDDEKSLITNQLVYKLASPRKIKETDWIKPGKATWEWWHDALLPGAVIPSGMDHRNTALYKYYVDFAADYGLEYLMIDAGWSDNYDLRKPRDNSGLDIRDVIAYAEQKKVGVFLWCVATTLLNDLDGNLRYIKSLGAKGVKVDFFDRDDQEAMRWYEQIANSAAEHQLMVNFHGCSKPAGLERAFPNVLNYEAVRGEESAKWDYTITPDHHLIIPFTRMVAGPLDYTPGSMRNVSKEKFKPIDPGLPLTMGTRCHELSLFVVLNQPFAMLSDSPQEYVKYPDIMKYLSAVPTTFDETKALKGKTGEYLVVAKRKGHDWFLGAITNWKSRKLQVDFSFLTEGETYEALIYSDADDSNQEASHYKYQTLMVNKGTVKTFSLAEGGGAVVYLKQR